MAAKKNHVSLFIRSKLKLMKIKKEKKQLKKEIGTEHHDFDLLEFIFEIIDTPFEWLMKITCPPVNDEQYDRLRTLAYPIPGLFLIWFCCHPVPDFTFLMYPLPLGILFTIIFFFALPKDGSYPSWGLVLTFLGVLGGLCWSYLMIEVLIDLLNSVGLILNLDEAYLGLTILAVGNALPDALTTVSMASKGLGVMAISGGYAGQLFGYLMGFGVSMLKTTLAKGPQQFDLFAPAHFQENFLSLLVVIFALLTVVSTYLYGIANGFAMDKKFGFFLFGLYAIFIVVATIFAVHKASYHF